MKRGISIFSVIILFALIISSCTKTGPSSPALTTVSATVDKTSNSVVIIGKVTNEGGSATTERGFCWSTSPNPSVSDNHIKDAFGVGEFTYNLQGLSLSTIYHVRAYAINGIGTGYGNDITFTTLTAGKFSNILISDTAITTAKVNVNIENFGNSTIFSQGVCYSTSTLPTILDTNKLSYKNITDKAFSIDLVNLKRGTKYYLRAFITSGVGTQYSDEVNFTTKPTLPSITTKAVTDISSKKASSGIAIIDDGGTPILEWGICLSGKTNPSITDRVFIGNVKNIYQLDTLLNLKYDSTYYIKAYAKNSVGIVYGQELSFTTIYQVGEVGPAGGFIFYDKGIYSDNWRYLEAAPKDTIDCNVGCYNIDIVTDSAIGMGLTNTNKIIALMCPESNVAAFVASKYQLNGFKDWFLPSYKELYNFVLSPKKSLFNLKPDEGLLPYYISSTMLGKTDLAMISPNGLTGNSLGRKYLFFVRPIRRF